MPVYPETHEDTVLYGSRNIIGDDDVTVRMIDGASLNIWGETYINGQSLQQYIDSQADFASNAETIAGTINNKAVTPASLAFSTPYVDVREFGAKGDGVTDDSAAIQAAVNAAASGTIGTVLIPDGVFRAANIRVFQGVGIIGPGGPYRYGFDPNFGGTPTKGAVLKVPAGAPATVAGEITITAGGTGYSSAPTVTFSGGGASAQATAEATISGGAVVAVILLSPGVGYTSTPTISFSGPGTGATATVRRTTPIFYTAASPKVCGLRFSGLTLEGVLGLPCQGIVIHDSFQASIDNCHFFNFEWQAIYTMKGEGTRISNCQVFGAQRPGTSFGERIGSCQIGSTDSHLVNMEIGAGFSTDQTNLWSAALLVDGGASMFTNIVCEGADVGVRIRSSHNGFVNVRADICYGHGFYLIRDNAGTSPPQYNRLVNCWGHRNSHYGNNLFDNFRIETGHSITGTQIIGCNSTNEPADGYAHRYGFFDGGWGSLKMGIIDSTAATRWHETPNTDTGIGVLSSNLVGPASGATTVNMAQRFTARINNSTPTTVTTITGGVHGQVIYFQVMDIGNTIFANSGTGTDAIKTRNGLPIVTQQYGVYSFVRIYSTWYEMAPTSSALAPRIISADFTVDLTDADRVIETNSASAIAVTIPTNATVAFPLGTEIRICRLGTGTATPTAAGGVVIRNIAAVATQYGTVQLRKRSTDEWVQSTA